MSVSTFFRDNTKMVIWIMVALMFAFLFTSVASQGRSLLNRRGASGETVATLSVLNVDIGTNDMQNAQRDFTIYERFGLINPILAAANFPNTDLGTVMLMLNMFEPVERDGKLISLTQLDEGQRLQNWATLTAEARAKGFEVSSMAVDQMLSQFPADSLNNLMVSFRKAGYLERDVKDAIANYLSVLACFNAASDGIVISDAEVREMFQDLLNTRDLAAVPVDASDYLDEIKLDQADEQIQAELEQMFQAGRQYFRDDNNNPNEFRFGYRLPRRVQLEYATISLDTLAKTIMPSEEKLYQFWSENKQRFAAAPAEGEVAVTPEYAEVKSKVRNQVRMQMAGAQVKDLGRRLLQKATEFEQDASNTGISALAMAVEEIGSPAISYVSDGRWYSSDSLSNDPVLRRSTGSDGRTLVEAAFSVDSFLPEKEKESARVKLGKVYPQTFSVINKVRGAVAWAVIAAEDSIAPTEMDAAITEQVRADWRLKQAYKIAVEKANVALGVARDKGFDEAAKTLGSEVVALDKVSKRDQIYSHSPAWGNYRVAYARQSAMQYLQWSMSQGDKENAPQQLPMDWYIEAAVSQPYVWGPSTMGQFGRLPDVCRQRVAEQVFAMPAVAETLESSAPAPADSVAVVELPEVRSVVLVQQLSDAPAYKQDLYDTDESGNSLRASLIRGETVTRKLALLKRWCASDRISARTGFVRKMAEDAESEATEADQPQDTVSK